MTIMGGRKMGRLAKGAAAERQSVGWHGSSAPPAPLTLNLGS